MIGHTWPASEKEVVVTTAHIMIFHTCTVIVEISHTQLFTAKVLDSTVLLNKAHLILSTTCHKLVLICSCSSSIIMLVYHDRVCEAKLTLRCEYEFMSRTKDAIFFIISRTLLSKR